MGALQSLLQPRKATLEVDDVESVAALVAGARCVVALTGAGVSAESGIPTFRDPRDGLWQRYDPALYATWWGFQSQPHLIWQLLRDFLAEHDPQPNAGHLALAQLERAGCLHAVVTQNVDGLHQAAGSGSVVELHGSLLECVCPRCAAPFGPSRAALLSAGASLPPLCGACGGPLKPSATLFGEALPPGAWDRAAALVDRCDVLLVVGTSASVQPAARLPGRAGRAGATVVELNLEATPLTGTVSDVLLRGRSAAVLPALAARVAQLRAVAGGGGRGGGGGAAAPRV